MPVRLNTHCLKSPAPVDQDECVPVGLQHTHDGCPGLRLQLLHRLEHSLDHEHIQLERTPALEDRLSKSIARNTLSKMVSGKPDHEIRPARLVPNCGCTGHLECTMEQVLEVVKPVHDCGRVVVSDVESKRVVRVEDAVGFGSNLLAGAEETTVDVVPCGSDLNLVRRDEGVLVDSVSHLTREFEEVTRLARGGRVPRLLVGTWLDQLVRWHGSCSARRMCRCVWQCARPMEKVTDQSRMLSSVEAPRDGV